jgi:transporter family-2 protein
LGVSHTGGECNEQDERQENARHVCIHAIIGPMTNLYILLMIIAGAAVAAQTAINAELRVVSASALWAMNISFAVTMVLGLAMVAAAAATGRLSAPAPTMWRAPWWIWVGGVPGAVYVLLAVVLTQRLGTGLLTAAGILGQLSTALLIDHYGWFGMPVSKLSVPRIVGGVLLMIGVVLTRWR